MKTINLKLSALLITKPDNIFYLTGFRGSFGMVLVTQKKTFLITDFRYLIRAKKEVDTKKIEIVNLVDAQKLINKYKTIGFESGYVTVARFKRMKKVYPKITWKAQDGLIEKMRIVKSDDEVKKMKKACQIGDKVLSLIKKELKVGITESTVEWRIRELIREHGGEGVSFDPIVAFGTHGSIPHHEVTNRKLKKGDAILLDFGVKYKGYCSDMTRMVYTSKPNAKQKLVYETVLEAQEKALKAVKAGVKISDLDKIARDHISDAGYGDKFGHSLGHGVGVEIHEEPSVSTNGNGRLVEGMAITIEPGIYLAGWGGVRIEDLVIVTKKGCKILTKSGKEIVDSIIKS